MQELDAIRADGRRYEDLISVFRHQARQCQDLLEDARAVWRDRAGQRAWQRYIDPQLAESKAGEAQLTRQREHHTNTMALAESAAEQIAAARAQATSIADALERAREDAHRAQDLAARSQREAEGTAERVRAAQQLMGQVRAGGDW